MSAKRGNIIPYLEWLQIEYFIPPTHSELLSAARLNQHNERVIYKELRENKVLDNVVYGWPKFRKEIEIFIN